MCTSSVSLAVKTWQRLSISPNLFHSERITSIKALAPRYRIIHASQSESHLFKQESGFANSLRRKQWDDFWSFDVSVSLRTCIFCSHTFSFLKDFHIFHLKSRLAVFVWIWSYWAQNNRCVFIYCLPQVIANSCDLFHGGSFYGPMINS